MRYGIIGTGGVGGYYGAKLAKAGRDVHFLFHSDYDHVMEHGLKVDSPEGNFTLEHINAYHDAGEMPVCDVVIVALKTTNNHLLPKLLAKVAGKETIMLLIQNGIGVEHDVEAMMPGIKLAAGTALICSAKNEPGHIEHMDLGHLNVSDYSCREGEVARLVADMREAGIDAEQTEYTDARWKKALWNMPFNGLSVVMNASTSALLENRHTRQLVRSMMAEVMAMGHAFGANGIDEAFADKMIEMTEGMVPYSPSMKLDYEFSRPMEILYLYTKPLHMAAEKGVYCPLLSMLEKQLLYFDGELRKFMSPYSEMPRLTDDTSKWPDPRRYNCDGRVAVGGDLSPERLISAYKHGFFPWYAFRFEEIYWHCPLERFVIDSRRVHISHSMRSLIRKQTYMVSVNQCFEGVIYCCGKLREHESAAWLGQHIIDAYTKLHKMGVAESVEVWKDDKLVGGLYGIKTKNIFIGESMFSLEPSASKLALIALGRYLAEQGIYYIDCQMETPHLKSMGGYYMDYEEYMQIMNKE